MSYCASWQLSPGNNLVKGIQQLTERKENFVAKGRDAQKSSKKKPGKTLKERRSEKKEKKANKR